LSFLLVLLADDFQIELGKMAIRLIPVGGGESEE